MLLLLLLGGVPASAKEALSLDDFVEHVLAQSLDARTAEFEVRLARAERAGAGLWGNPALEYSRQTTAGEESPSQDVLVASIPLVLSGRLGLERRAADLGVEAAEARRQGSRAELRHRATGLFLRLLTEQERARVLSESIAALEQLVRRMRAREEAGESSGYDRIRFEFERALAQDALRDLEASTTALRMEALRLRGNVDGVLPPLNPALPALPAQRNAQVLLAELEGRRGDLRALELEASAAEAEGRAARRRGIPDPTLSVGPLLVDVGGPASGAGLVLGVGLPVPLFDRGQGARAAATARRESTELQHALVLQEARARVVGLLSELELREERRVRHEQDVLARAENLMRMTEAAYAGGEAGLLELVDAVRALREARLARIELNEKVRLVENDLMLVAGAYDAAAAGDLR